MYPPLFSPEFILTDCAKKVNAGSGYKENFVSKNKIHHFPPKNIKRPEKSLELIFLFDIFDILYFDLFMTKITIYCAFSGKF